MRWLLPVTLAGAAVFSSCGREPRQESAAVAPSILLVTLDTTRADAIGSDAEGVDTPAFDALAARGVRFTQAYATAPETLPSHASMMTGLYPAGHGVHENARPLQDDHPVLAEILRTHAYRTAAFVSSFVLARRFGLARGFEHYDDEQPSGAVERSARETTDRVEAYLASLPAGPVFLWIHYFDPHAPYAPPEPHRSRYPANPYLAEVAAMDEQLGRLVAVAEAHAASSGRPLAIIVAGDHGEGLGDHGELQHGNLLYQSTMRVPMVMIAPALPPGVHDAPVSVRRVFHTVLGLAGVADRREMLQAGPVEVVLGEAMKPFLSYGWQPQVMGIEETTKGIYAGRLEVYDVVEDPGEATDLAGRTDLPPSLRKALEEYPFPEIGAPPAARLDDDARRRLASLGYVAASARPVARRNAPRPAEMVHLFETIEKASGLFVRERYAEAIPLLEKILAADAFNLDAALRLATAHSALGHESHARAAFKRAAEIQPKSPDVRTYLALHYARGREWQQAIPMLEEILAESPDRLPAVEALASLRERQGRLEEALALRQRIHTLRPPAAADHLAEGRLAMALQRTAAAIASFEEARALQGQDFRHDLELGALYLDARRFAEARDALDRVPPAHPDYPMALFKRAQVSVLLNEPDRAARIEAARRRADATTRPLIARERLFRQGI